MVFFHDVFSVQKKASDKKKKKSCKNLQQVRTVPIMDNLVERGFSFLPVCDFLASFHPLDRPLPGAIPSVVVVIAKQLSCFAANW